MLCAWPSCYDPTTAIYHCCKQLHPPMQQKHFPENQREREGGGSSVRTTSFPLLFDLRMILHLPPSPLCSTLQIPPLSSFFRHSYSRAEAATISCVCVVCATMTEGGNLTPIHLHPHKKACLCPPFVQVSISDFTALPSFPSFFPFPFFCSTQTHRKLQQR